MLSFKTLKELDPVVGLQIIDGPDLVSVTTESLTVSWLTNLHSDSRLVCEAEDSSSSQSSSANSLAVYNEADPSRVIEDRYIVLLKDNVIASQLLKTTLKRSDLVFPAG